MKSLIYAFITLLILLSFNVQAQFISNKEATRINDLLKKVSEQNQPKTYVFKNVSTLTMLDSLLIEQDVLVENGLIKQIGANITSPNAIEIDGKGKFLMPGLTDMHIHLFHKDQLQNTWLLLLLTHGVTSVRDMAGEEGKTSLRNRISNNEILGPNLYQAGPIMDGRNPDLTKVIVATPEEAKQEVRRQREAGYDFIKVYNDLKVEVYWAIIEEARKLNIPVIGHVPYAVDLEEALRVQHSIEHLTGYKEWQGDKSYLNVNANYANQTAKANTWNCPTFYHQYMNWEGLEAANKMVAEQSDYVPSKLKSRWSKMLSKNVAQKNKLLQQFGATNKQVLTDITLNLYHANAKLIAGTDASGNSINIPGFSLHRELIALHEIGIPIFEVLKMTTVNAGLAMNKTNEFGSIEVGQRADLLLLESNPLENINNLKIKAGVMVRGIWLSNKEISLIKKEIKFAFGNE